MATLQRRAAPAAGGAVRPHACRRSSRNPVRRIDLRRVAATPPACCSTSRLCCRHATWLGLGLGLGLGLELGLGLGLGLR